jgi:hypothetical protein
MNSSQLRELATDFLVPFIAGSRLEAAPRGSKANGKRVWLADPHTMLFKAAPGDAWQLALCRNQPFAVERSGITELRVVEAFLEVVGSMASGLRQWYKTDLRAAFPRRVVVKALCTDRAEEDSMLTIIDQFTQWAGRLYEGKSITAAVGVIHTQRGGKVSFTDFCKRDFSAVLSNGIDTLITCGSDGTVVGHAAVKPEYKHSRFAPYHLTAIAEWASRSRTAFVLNHDGEILVFKSNVLRFASRAAQWHFLRHSPTISQMLRPKDVGVRRAVYETCLDASFARAGAAIGVVTRENIAKWKAVAPAKDDHLEKPQSLKSASLAAMVNGRKFQELDRRLRQELVAIDGATLIDYSGTVLAVGAIVKIEGGSEGGGRLAAARALSKLGLGIKVSQDGAIRGFHEDSSEPKFYLM